MRHLFLLSRAQTDHLPLVDRVIVWARDNYFYIKGASRNCCTPWKVLVPHVYERVRGEL